jgi:hypothetical protein
VSEAVTIGISLPAGHDADDGRPKLNGSYSLTLAAEEATVQAEEEGSGRR